MNEEHKQALGARLRRLRTQKGLTQVTVAKQSGIHLQTWRTWEAGRSAYRPWRAVEIAQALDVPVKQLFVDDVVLAEITLRPETLEDVRQRGDEAVQDALARLNSWLGPMILQAATRPKADGRAQRRRTRPEKLSIPQPMRRRREIS